MFPLPLGAAMPAPAVGNEPSRNTPERHAMKTMFSVVLCAAALGVMALSPSALAQQKTAKQCNDEWAADQVAIRANGKTKQVFVAECRGVPLKPRTAAALPLGERQFAAEGDAKASCPGDTVVWVNLRSRVAHTSGTRSYGQTKQGAYMCEKASVEAGYHAARTRAGTRAGAGPATPAAGAAEGPT